MNLISLAKNPVPGGALVGEMPSFDGKRLRYARWEATRGPRRGTVCLFHGRGEYIEKYFEVISDLRRRGFAVATLDWRGQGGSQRLLSNPYKGHIWDFAEFDKDLTRFMKDIVLPDCPPPFVALAHSMGGAILLRNAARRGSWFERMVLVAPMIALDQRKAGYPPLVVRTYAETACLFGMGGAFVPNGSDQPAERQPFEGNELTSDRERFQRNKSVLEVAPSLGLGSATIGWLRAAYRAMGRLREPDFAHRIEVPMLLLAAGNDCIVATRAIEDFGVRLKVGTHIMLPGSRHEILQESDAIRQRFWAAFDAYLGVNEAAA
jgi:lysophospholipase